MILYLLLLIFLPIVAPGCAGNPPPCPEDNPYLTPVCVGNQWQWRYNIKDWTLDIASSYGAVFDAVTQTTTVSYRNQQGHVGIAEQITLKRGISQLQGYSQNDTTVSANTNPTLAIMIPGQLDLAWNDNGALMQRSYNTSTGIWGTISRINNDTIIQSPSMTSRGVGIMDLAYLTNGGTLRVISYDTVNGWGTPHSISNTPTPLTTISSPSIAATGPDVVITMAIDIHGDLKYRYRNVTSWFPSKGWALVASAAAVNTTAPSVACAGLGVIDLVYRGVDNSLKWKKYNGTMWIDGHDTLAQLPSLLGRDPTVIPSQGGNRTVFLQLQNGTQFELIGGCPAENLASNFL